MRFNIFVWLFVCYGIICNHSAFAQLLNVDSCIRILNVSKEDTNKVILLDAIAWNISYSNLQKGISYSSQSYDLAKQLHFERYYPKILNTKGAIYTDMGELSKSVTLFLEGLTVAKKLNQLDMIAKLYNSLGNSYNEQGNRQRALSYYFQSIEIGKKINNPKITYISNSNVAFCYIGAKKLDSAMYYVNLCLDYNIKNNNSSNLINNYILLSQIYYDKNEKIQCLFAANEAVTIAKKINNSYTLSHAYQQLASALQMNGKNQEAAGVLNEAIKIGKATGDIQLLRIAYFSLSDVYEQMSDYKNSLSSFKEHKKYQDSTINYESIQQIKNAEAKYENEKKQKEIELLGEKQKLNEAENQKKKVYLYAAIFGLFVLGFVLVFLYRNNIAKQKTNKQLEIFNKEIHLQKDLVEEKNKEITDSINYAKRIQQSILTSENYFKKNTTDYFILFKPKDIVSGDFYWALNHHHQFLVMTADCTGHGVPGAMMSMMGVNFLNEIVNEKNMSSPAAILNQLRSDIIKALNQDDQVIESKDGMDCNLCKFDFVNLKLTYSNANNSFYILRNGELLLSKTNKMPVGAGQTNEVPFEEWQIDLQKNDLIITLTDGYADQFGGPKGKKFKYKQLEDLILTSADLPLCEIKTKLEGAIDYWKKDLEQVDDICVIGIKI